jgi:hypothetical protein
MAKTPLNRADLEQHLADQLKFLEQSADAFDKGFAAEYRRMALAIRVLVHDTRNSHALLDQLGRLTINFVDTADPLEPGELLTYSGLTMIVHGGENGGFAAPLDKADSRRTRHFEEWWAQPVMKDGQGRLLARKDLVLTAADQDGGGHVDPALDETYADISQRNSLGWVTRAPDGSWKELPGAERAAIRQIAHETLKTLQPGYAKLPDTAGAAIMFRGASVRVVAPQQFPASPVSQNAGRLRPKDQGRNEACACNSGKKYKHCCGAL